MANSPAYYSRGLVQPWDFIRDQELNYHLGCAIKYICRAGHKDSKADDLRKAIHYLENELKHTRDEPDVNGSPVQESVWTGVDLTGFTEVFDR